MFSIRTEVCGTTKQSNGNSINTSDEQFVITSIPVGNYGHVTPTRELPHYTTRVVGVAQPGWWISTNSWSNISERDDLSSVVSARGLIGWCQSNCMPLIYNTWCPGTKSILVSLTRIRSRGPVNTKYKYIEQTKSKPIYRFAVFIGCSGTKPTILVYVLALDYTSSTISIDLV